MTRGGAKVSLDFVPGQNCMCLRLNAPRANALEPGILREIGAALDTVDREAPAALLIAGGANFCSGGDVAGFLAAAREGRAQAYADEVVPRLHDILLRLVGMPRVVATAARGAITGGGAGFLFSADLAMVESTAFVQPYYLRMGFAPDGGWTALLPDLVGAGAASHWLQTDRRADAPELCRLGLAARIDEAPEEAALAVLRETDLGARNAAKALLWDAPRRARARRRLEAEVAAFRARIGEPETRRNMEAFLERREEGKRV